MKHFALTTVKAVVFTPYPTETLQCVKHKRRFHSWLHLEASLESIPPARLGLAWRSCGPVSLGGAGWSSPQTPGAAHLPYNCRVAPGAECWWVRESGEKNQRWHWLGGPFLLLELRPSGEGSAAIHCVSTGQGLPLSGKGSGNKVFKTPSTSDILFWVGVPSDFLFGKMSNVQRSCKHSTMNHRIHQLLSFDPFPPPPYLPVYFGCTVES